MSFATRPHPRPLPIPVSTRGEGVWRSSCSHSAYDHQAMTRLCVAIFVHSAEQAVRDTLCAVENGADMVELRIDLHESINATEILSSISNLIDTPVILTYRPVWEGGQSEVDSPTRLLTLTL